MSHWGHVLLNCKCSKSVTGCAAPQPAIQQQVQQLKGDHNACQAKLSHDFPSMSQLPVIIAHDGLRRGSQCMAHGE